MSRYFDAIRRKYKLENGYSTEELKLPAVLLNLKLSADVISPIRLPALKLFSGLEKIITQKLENIYFLTLWKEWVVNGSFMYRLLWNFSQMFISKHIQFKINLHPFIHGCLRKTLCCGISWKIYWKSKSEDLTTTTKLTRKHYSRKESITDKLTGLLCVYIILRRITCCSHAEINSLQPSLQSC